MSMSNLPPSLNEREKLLVVEDDPAIQRVIADYFRHAGYDVITAGDGETGARLAIHEKPSALILDLMLPKMDGLAVCREVRRRNPGLPIIMLTARDDVVDKVVGLEMGADDYLTKPFSPRELEARIKTIMRRARATPAETVEEQPAMIAHGNLRIDPARREVTIGERMIDLTPKEFELLSLFAAHPGRVYTRKYLLENVWDYTYGGYDRTIDSHINRLRAKIEDNPDEPNRLLTVWGVGYKFSDPPR
jgi:DNA-binding response OmpR family regulator